MESPTAASMLGDRLPTEQPRFHVKNTFLEVEGDSDGSLDLSDSWARASTEPAKVFSLTRRPSQTKLAAPAEPDPVQEEEIYQPRQCQEPPRSLKEPQYVYTQKGKGDVKGREAAQNGRSPLDGGNQPSQEALRMLEMSPELAPVFKSIKKGGAEAAVKYLRDPSLLQKIGRTVAEPKVPPSTQQAPVPQQHPAPNGGTVDLTGLVHALSSMEESVVRQASLTAIRNMPCSVTLADPGLDDCPLIGCSEGFEALTGYSAKEVVGQNCRFLNRGTSMDANMRQALREAISLGREFIGVLPNFRKNGQRFSNLLRLSSTYVRGKRYILGVQADVTDIEIDLGNPVHVDELRSAARRIFSSNVDAWVQMQAQQFFIRRPMNYAELLKADAPQQFQEAQGQFVVMNLGAEKGRFQPQPEAATKAPVPQAGASPNTADRGLLASEWSTSAASVAGGDRSTDSESSDEDQDSGSGAEQGRRRGQRGGARRRRRRPNKEEEEEGQPEAQVEGAVDAALAEAAVWAFPASSQEAQESADGSRSAAARGPVRSIGSAGHPDACNSECIFYFFRDGCRAGENCRFCHEFHRRKNMKKNRRILRRLCNEAGAPASGTGDDDMESRMAGSEQGVGQTPSASGAQGAAASSSTTVPEERPMAPRRAAEETDDSATVLSAVTYWYGPEVGPPGEMQSLTFLAGMGVQMPARVEVTAKRRQELQHCLSYSVEPALPSGLRLDGRTGNVSGAPVRVQEPTVHTFTASIAATGPGGINLGQVHLASTRMRICVAEPQRFSVEWSQAHGSGLTLRLQQN